MKSLLIVFAALLTGCAATLPTMQEVKVAVPVECTPQNIPKPVMPFDTQAKVGMTLYQKVKLLLAQDLRNKAYQKQLEVAAKSCEKADIERQFSK